MSHVILVPTYLFVSNVSSLERKPQCCAVVTICSIWLSCNRWCIRVVCMCSLFLKMNSGVWKFALICWDRIMRREFALPLCKPGWPLLEHISSGDMWSVCRYWNILRDAQLNNSKVHPCPCQAKQMCYFHLGWHGMEVKNIWLWSIFPIFLFYQERLDAKWMLIFLMLVTPWKLHANKKYCRHNETCGMTHYLLPINLPCNAGNFGKPVFVFCAQVATSGCNVLWWDAFKQAHTNSSQLH